MRTGKLEVEAIHLCGNGKVISGTNIDSEISRVFLYDLVGVVWCVCLSDVTEVVA